ncbi:MAG: UDP-N-acetylmuramoyl-L-alanyl-D-glutamate--2,6-diaminopimelate ligase [Clostridia bacterium]|nr:UDP-N-acetylmuramoyl-L-alanyl-D-glutamate--2,6-diaminopimelate ligase [Clostridia bacterium]
MKTLNDLAVSMGLENASAAGELQIAELCMDSRKQEDHGLFFCISGSHFDGHAFAPTAVKNGAVALVTERPLPELAVPQLVVENSRVAMALAAAAFYDHPDRQMRLLGLTGTKGKTTTSYLIQGVLEQTGAACGVIGTIGAYMGGKLLKSGLTTPDPIDLQKTLRVMADAGAEYVSMEVSAHAIAMHRLEGVRFETGCYTNLSQDHLDYFGTMERYFDCKRSFFHSHFIRNAALNADDEHTPQIQKTMDVPSLTYGICTPADVMATDIEITEDGVDFVMRVLNTDKYPVHLQLTGMFNVYNALAAAAVCLNQGIDPKDIAAALGTVRAVPGRAEVLDTHTTYKVILDYSHSPDALENILNTVREFTRGRVIALFGCGGDRDHIKRPIMGEIGGKLADYCVLTSDNPRTEDPYEILAAVEKGVKHTQTPYSVIENRREAIRFALEMARDGDVIVLAGKGHETYQEINGVKRPFDEKVVVAELLKEMRKDA